MLDFFPHAVDAGAGLVVLDDLRLSDIRNLKLAGDLAEPPGTFLLPPDLFFGGRFYDFDLRFPAKVAVEQGQKYDDDCYFENMIYKHATTPCSEII